MVNFGRYFEFELCSILTSRSFVKIAAGACEVSTSKGGCSYLE